MSLHAHAETEYTQPRCVCSHDLVECLSCCIELPSEYVQTIESLLILSMYTLGLAEEQYSCKDSQSCLRDCLLFIWRKHQWLYQPPVSHEIHESSLAHECVAQHGHGNGHVHSALHTHCCVLANLEELPPALQGVTDSAAADNPSVE